MENVYPAAVLSLFERHPRIVVPALIVVVEVAVGPGPPDNLWHALGQKTVLLLTLLEFDGALDEGVLGPLSFCNVGTDGHVLRRFARLVEKRNNRRVHPV